jgi:hypothetical protein
VDNIKEKITGSAALAGSPRRRQDKKKILFLLSCRRLGDPASAADPVIFSTEISSNALH